MKKVKLEKHEQAELFFLSSRLGLTKFINNKRVLP